MKIYSSIIKNVNLIDWLLLRQILLWCMVFEPVVGSVIRLEKDASSLGGVLLNTLGRPFAAVTPSEKVSPLCKEHSVLYLQELSNLTPWAIHMYDASTNIPSGLVTGNTQQMGNYDQCLGIEVKDDNQLQFRGQQCRATFQFRRQEAGERNSSDFDMKDLFEALLKASDSQNWNSPDSAPYIWALCVPSTCSALDVENHFKELLLSLNVENRIEVILSVSPNDCIVADTMDIHFSDSQVAIICLIAIFVLILIGSTSYDLIVNRQSKKQNKSKRYAILMSFSLYTNGKNLISTSIGSDTMTCLHGLRFLSIFWILFGHTYYMKSISPNINHIVVKYYDQNISRMLVMNATITTDTFFVLSGTLLSYTFMREWEKKASFNVLTFYLHRYLRLTPPYAFVIFFYATLMYHLGSGPNWNSQMGLNRDYCIENWWTNLLYINNYINIDRMCMNQTWYLAVDMQLFWLSPLLLYPLAKWPRFGKALLGFIILGSILIPLIITMALRLTAVMLYNKDLLMVGNVYKHMYSRTYTRAGPYFIGIALGYLLHNLRGKPINIPKVYVAVCWLLAMASCIAVVFGAAVFYKDGHEYSVLESGIYAGLHRSIWALSIAWMAFACIKGYGGPVDTFLSWKLFVPLSRLTFCAYLCHYIVLLYNIGSVRTPGYLSDYHIVHEFSGNFVLSFALAMVISLAFEIPFMNLDKILLRPSHGAPQKMTNETNDTMETEEASKRKVSYDNIGFNEGLQSENHRVAAVYVISDHSETMSKNLVNSAIPLELHNYET